MMGKVGEDMYGLALGSSQIATTEAFATAASQARSREQDSDASAVTHALKTRGEVRPRQLLRAAKLASLISHQYKT
jgi:hypothetical protein